MFLFGTVIGLGRAHILIRDSDWLNDGHMILFGTVIGLRTGT